jgi:MEMO1 family protein
MFTIRNSKSKDDVLNSRLAGTWYTSDPEELKREIDGYIACAETEQHEKPIALILPHAGYAYSGATAAYGIKQLKDRSYKRVIVMGPTHRYEMRNLVSMPSQSQYSTPLGRIDLDTEFMDRLAAKPFATRNSQAHYDEHSVQIELPLLQRVLDEFKLVPIVCGQLDLATCARLGASLRTMIDEDTLLVASSDFTHFGPRFAYTPFESDVPNRIRQLDMGAFSKIENKDAKGFMNYVDETGATICGRVPIAVLLNMLSEDAEVKLLKYDSSGRMTGDYDNTVSYLAAVVSGEWGSKASSESDSSEEIPDGDPELDQRDKATLLQLARATLASYMEKGRRPSSKELAIEISAGMRQVMGAFVTLHKDGRLRGCIGEIVPRRPLYLAVMDHAVNSAVNDHRFPQLAADELDDIQIEISALTPPKEVDAYDDIEIGRHGILLQKGLRAAVFLPQVAPEQGWGLEETLTHLALKAGLPPDGWREGAQFQVFEAIVFEEQ